MSYEDGCGDVAAQSFAFISPCKFLIFWRIRGVSSGFCLVFHSLENQGNAGDAAGGSLPAGALFSEVEADELDFRDGGDGFSAGDAVEGASAAEEESEEDGGEGADEDQAGDAEEQAAGFVDL